jgi:hypothetical protein
MPFPCPPRHQTSSLSSFSSPGQQPQDQFFMPPRLNSLLGTLFDPCRLAYLTYI